MDSVTGLSKVIGILPNQGEQSLSMVFIIFSTSSQFVFCSINCSVVELSVSDLMEV